MTTHNNNGPARPPRPRGAGREGPCPPHTLRAPCLSQMEVRHKGKTNIKENSKGCRGRAVLPSPPGRHAPHVTPHVPRRQEYDMSLAGRRGIPKGIQIMRSLDSYW